ncbi:MAG: sugar phosphate isomerase/epimerase [Anaerolineae bacterium]|nr:sugar phosphate isomerase/epimerase [Anaerolineae bacterium]
MQWGVQEHLLPGDDPTARFSAAREMGFDGVEVEAQALNESFMEYAHAIESTGMPIAAVNAGKHPFLAEDQAVRRIALTRLQQSLADATDLRSPHVLFVPHWRDSGYDPVDAEEQPRGLKWILSNMPDLAYAMGVELHMQPTSDSYIVNTVKDAWDWYNAVRKPHHLFIAPCTHDTADEKWSNYADRITYAHISGPGRTLPVGLPNIIAQVPGLNWLTIAADSIGDGDLAESLARVRR